MWDELEMNPSPRRPARQAGRLVLLLGFSLLAANCAGGGNSIAQVIGAAPKQDASLAANPAASGPPQNLPYRSFGAPAQIGDRKVMTPGQTEELQANLEQLAAQREKQMLNEIEQSQ